MGYRSCGRFANRADQDGGAVSIRTSFEVQPTDEDLRTIGRTCQVCGLLFPVATLIFNIICYGTRSLGKVKFMFAFLNFDSLQNLYGIQSTLDNWPLDN